MNVMNEEFKRVTEARNSFAESAIKRHATQDWGEGLEDLFESNPSKARNTAVALSLQEAHLNQLSESIISTELRLRPENVLKVVRIGVANSNRGDFATEYPLQTTDDAIYHIDMTYEKSLRGATAGDKIYENVHPYYVGEQQIANIDPAGAGTSYTVTISTPKPIVPYTIRILVGGALVGNDDGAGNLSYTGQDTGAANTVDYTSGQFVFNFVGAPGAAIDVLYDWNSEDESLYDQFGTVGIKLRKTRFEARPQILGYSFTTMTEIALETTGIGNAEDLLVGAVGDEHAKSRDYKAIAKLRMVALGNGIDTFDADFAAAGEVSDKLHAQKLMSKIKQIGGQIYNDIKRGQVNKAIAGSDALVYMMKHDNWVDDTSQPRTGVYKAGRFGDIDVFACPADSQLVNANEIILTYKNPEEGLDVGIVFGVLTEIAATLMYPEFRKVGNVASVEDSRVINSKFVRILQLNNLP